MNKVYMTWEMFDNAIDKIINEIAEHNWYFDGVYGVPNGGLVLAVTLSYRLKLPLLISPTRNTLTVDDISDSGATLATVKGKKIVTLYSTKWTKTIPDFHVYEKEMMEDWIVFPYEE
ncbi:MAG: phosphoribosyltransferase [Candidatus Thorarchaeota archaeon]